MTLAKKISSLTYTSCPTHCCVKHGCKYALEKCPVFNRQIHPVYPNNNGCETCEDDVKSKCICPVISSGDLPGADHEDGCPMKANWSDDAEPAVEVDRITVSEDVGGPYPVYKKVTLLLMSNGTVRWEAQPDVP